MKTKLYNYQEKIRDDIISKNDFSVGLFMKMGTGKTVTSLSVFEHLRNKGLCNRLLVVCLKCKIEDWKRDIQEEFEGSVPEHEVINFESIWRPKRADYFKNFINENTMIIVDESHKIKAHTSKVTKYLLDVYNQTKYKLILTGTPQSQQYIDYYPQMKFINAKDFDIPYRQWDKTYLIKKLDNQGGHYFYTIEGYNYEEVLQKGITDKAYYHNYESQYEKPMDIYVSIEHSKDARKFQKDRVWRDPDEERCDDVIADTQFALRTYLRQSCSGFIKQYDIDSPKEEWLNDFLEITQDRVVIFTNFIKEIEKVEAICKKLNKPISYYYGAKKDLKNFKEQENGVAIVNYASGAVGINDLCISNIGVFYSPPDGNYIDFQQARSRLDRIGQTKQPIFYYLETKGSVEKAIYASLKVGENFDLLMFQNWLNSQK